MATITHGPHSHVGERWTAERVRELPDDGNWYEVIDGELFVSPAPGYPHQSVGSMLHGLLWTYLRQVSRERMLLCSPADISWNEDTLVQPDLFITHPDEVKGTWKEIQTLLLAIEIVSPSSRATDYMRKRLLYQRYGVREYWIVDPKRACVEVWRPDSESPDVAKETLVWHPDPALASPAHPTLEPLTLDLTELFRPLGAPKA